MLDTLAVTGGRPMASSTGKVISVPEPTTVLIVPAATPATKTTRICQLFTLRRLGPSVGVRVAPPAVLPVAAHGGVGPGQASLLEEQPADALHGRRLAGHPRPRARGEVGGRVRRPRAHPPGPYPAAGPASARSRPDATATSRRPPGSATSISACTGLSAGRRSSSWLMAGMAVSSPARKKPGAVLLDRVTTRRTGNRRRAPRLGAPGPAGCRSRPVDDDLDIQLESRPIDAGAGSGSGWLAGGRRAAETRCPPRRE